MIDEHTPPTIGQAPPRPTLLEALGRYWVIVVVPAVVLLAGALALGLARSPTYTAETQLNVGQTDITTQAIPGFTQAAETLANAYSRLVSSRVIAEPVAKRVNLPVTEVSARLSGTPVSESAVFRVKAEGDTARQALALSAAGSAEVREYVKRLGTTKTEANQLLAQYRQAAREAQRLNRQSGRVRADEGSDSARAEALGVQASTARLRQETIAQRYQEARPSTAGATIQVLDQPTSADSDRTSALQRFAFVGLFGGLLIGVALAVLLANRAWRRSIQGY